MNSLDYLLKPRNMAVLGASSNPQKIGYKIVQNIVANSYTGKVFPVNPKGGSVSGIPIWKDILEIPEEIDVATIVVPGHQVLEAAQGCAQKGVKFLSVISSGFSEAGKNKEEQELLSFAKEHSMRILGPNIFGYYSSPVSLNATFGPSQIQPGPVVIISQSGALGVAMIGKTAMENLGLSAIVSMGNKADLNESDFLPYFSQDPSTKVILIYMEGAKEGERLLQELRLASKCKPVIIIKSGRSKKGAQAVASHTGSLAGSDEVFDALMKQCGVLRAESLDEAFLWAKFLCYAALPKGENTVIITNGGGVGVMAADACEKYGIHLYDNVEKLKKLFDPVTPEFGSTKNPVDLTGQADYSDYHIALEACLNDEEIHTVIALDCETPFFDAKSLRQVVEEHYEKYRRAGKVALFSAFGGKEAEDTIHPLQNMGLPVYDDTYEAMSCLGALYRYYHYLNRKSDGTLPVFSLSEKEIAPIFSEAKAKGLSFLTAPYILALTRSVGLPIPAGGVAKNLDEALKKARELHYPLVMKVVSPQILHKSDAGGIVVGIQNEKELEAAYQAILEKCRLHSPQAEIEGVEVIEMAKPALELIVGGRKDPQFGPLLMFGLGGIYVEIFKEVHFRSLPMDTLEVRQMVEGSRIYPLLKGVRGEKPRDIEALMEVLFKVAWMLQNCPEIQDLEINPLRIYEKGVKALDVRVTLKV